MPCTGTGTWRRRPENIIWLNNKELNDFKKTQYNILSEAAQLCKSGGQLIYITCSLLYDENEYQIKKFLKNNTDFQAFNIEERVKSFFRDNISGISRYGFVLTPDILNTDGYFISILNKSIN